MEMDQSHLKDMGIKKVGDRVRIGSQAKQLRNKEYKKASRRVSNRVSVATWVVHVVLIPIAITCHVRQRCLHTTLVCLASTITLRTLHCVQLPKCLKTHVETNHHV